MSSPRESRHRKRLLNLLPPYPLPGNEAGDSPQGVSFPRGRALSCLYLFRSGITEAPGASPPVVGGFAVLKHRFDNSERLDGSEAAALLQHISKRLPVDVLHRQIDEAVRLPLLESPDNLRVTEFGFPTRLP